VFSLLASSYILLVYYTKVEWADLQIIDLSEAGTPDGRARLAKQVRDAMVTTGFFCVINHGYKPEQVS
jgi:isopenicillin N synthase-like dioxygenase